MSDADMMIARQDALDRKPATGHSCRYARVKIGTIDDIDECLRFMNDHFLPNDTRPTNLRLSAAAESEDEEDNAGVEDDDESADGDDSDESDEEEDPDAKATLLDNAIASFQAFVERNFSQWY
jgi:hypothetical protein